MLRGLKASKINADETISRLEARRIGYGHRGTPRVSLVVVDVAPPLPMGSARGISHPGIAPGVCRCFDDGIKDTARRSDPFRSWMHPERRQDTGTMLKPRGATAEASMHKRLSPTGDEALGYARVVFRTRGHRAAPGGRGGTIKLFVESLNRVSARGGGFFFL